MSKNKIVLIVGIVFVVLMAGAYFLYDELSDDVERKVLSEQTETDTNIDESEEDSKGEEAGNNAEREGEDSQEKSDEEAKMQAPDFTVYDIEGNAVNLSDFIGKPTIVNFWASWCGPCKSEMPDFEAAYLEQGEEIHFLSRLYQLPNVLGFIHIQEISLYQIFKTVNTAGQIFHCIISCHRVIYTVFRYFSTAVRRLLLSNGFVFP